MVSSQEVLVVFVTATRASAIVPFIVQEVIMGLAAERLPQAAVSRYQEVMMHTVANQLAC